MKGGLVTRTAKMSFGWVWVVQNGDKIIRVGLGSQGQGKGDRRLKKDVMGVMRKGVRFKRWRLDWSGLSEFARRVLIRCQEIGFGEVRSYGELAKAVGKPNAARAVGQVLSRNPFPILIPCHRVVGSDGRLGGFSGGLRLKKRLLEFEGWRVVGKGSNLRLAERGERQDGRG